MSSKILGHPDKEEIIRMLGDGETVRKIEKYLKNKYPNDKSKWITHITLQTYRKEKLNLEGKVLKDIQEAREAQKRQIELTMQQRQLESTNAYQEKINSIADTHLDVSKKIIQLDSVVASRIEYWFNIIASGEELPAVGDRELRKYMDQQMLILQNYKKLVEGMADKTVDYNVNVTVLNDQISVIRDAIKAVLVEMGSEYATVFLDKLNKKLNQMPYRATELASSEVNMKQLKDVEFALLEDGINDQ